MTPENKITEIPAHYSTQEMDEHMEKMNKEGFEVVSVHKKESLLNSTHDSYQIFWKRVSWPQ